MRIVFVRHGETTGQSSIRYYGSTDVPLSALGEAQMRRAGDALAPEVFGTVVSSRLSRSRRAATLVARPGTEPVVVGAFDEVDFGSWEGWTREEIAARDPVNFRRWQNDPENFQYPGGECRSAFKQRVAAGWRTLVAESQAGSMLLVLHRGVIALIVAELLELSPAQRRELAIDLGSIHVLVRRCAGWQAEVLNGIDHLTDIAPPAVASAGAS